MPNEFTGDLFRGWMTNYLLCFILSFVLSVIFTKMAIKFLLKMNVLDLPNERKIHTRPIPRMGGIAIWLGFVIPLFILGHTTQEGYGIIIGSGIALLIGSIDDLFGVPATIKLISLILLTLLMWKFGVLTTFPCIIEDYRVPFNVIITVFWISGVCSAINAIDHMDGLATGLSSVAASAYLAVSVQTSQWFWGMISVALLGSLLGFLLFNWHPAKIFMGDSGSFFLGFSLASIGIMGGWSASPLKSMIIPFLILSIPIMDLIYVILIRRITGLTKSFGESISYCAKDHIGHRLFDFGFSQPNSVKIILLLSLTVALSALVIRHTQEFETILLLFQILLVYTIIFILMGRNVTVNNRG